MKTLFLLIACLIMHACYAQVKEDKFYLFGKNWKPTGIKTAAYILIVRQPTQSNYLWIYYNIFGPRISQESFTDETGKVRNGKCLYYHANGSLDSIGEYVNDVLNGSWYFYNEDGSIIRQKDYDKGLLIKDTLFDVRNDVSVKAEPVPGEVESVFRGGQQGWVKFLTKNFNYPKRALDANIMGTVRLQFVIDISGNVTEPEVNKSVEFSLDEEALRIIKESPDWVPASKDGTVLKSYKLQPITFRFTR